MICRAILVHKDAKAYLRGLWMIEFAELSQFKRSETEEIKSFLSTRVDKYRPAFGRLEHYIPRECIFVATTNRHDQFKDETGNRRFWPVSVYGVSDLAGIAAARNQLWAEAVVRYKAGEPWYLTGDVLRQAEEEQRAHVDEDAWTATINTYIGENFETLGDVAYRGRTVKFLTVAFLLQEVLELEPLHWTVANAHRVGSILRLQQWQHARIENPDKDLPGQPRQLRGFVKGAEPLKNSSEPQPPHL